MKDEIVEKSGSLDRLASAVLLVATVFVLAPLVIAVVTASQSYQDFVQHGFSISPGTHLIENTVKLYRTTKIFRQITNSLVVALAIATVKCLFAFLAAYALVFFRVRYTSLMFAILMSTVAVPLDLRVITTYQILSNVAMPINELVAILSGLSDTVVHHRFDIDLKWNLLDTYAGIVAPALATGTGVFIMRQFFKTVPVDLVKAAQIDGAGWFRFMVDILLPISRTPLIALFILMFLGGWTMYMWPLVAASTPEMQTAIVGIAHLRPNAGADVPDMPLIMSAVLVASALPVLLIASLQRFIVRGITLTEK